MYSNLAGLSKYGPAAEQKWRPRPFTKRARFIRNALATRAALRVATKRLGGPRFWRQTTRKRREHVSSVTMITDELQKDARLST